MKDIAGVLFTALLVFGAFHYDSLLLGIGAFLMGMIMIEKFNQE